MRLDLQKEKDSNWHLDDKLIPLSHQKNTFGLIYTRGQSLHFGEVRGANQKNKRWKKQKLTLARHMDLWRWGARKVLNFCAPLSQTSARRANFSFFFFGQFFRYVKTGGTARTLG